MGMYRDSRHSSKRSNKEFGRYWDRDIQKNWNVNQHEKEKKRQYNERILEIDHGSFTPLVFSIHGGMGRECSMFYNRLAQKISEKKDIHKSTATNWIRTKLSFALLKSALLCIRGSRSLTRNVCLIDDDIKIAHEVAKI